ncbi:MAG TPA: A/G-specific adenine glycosylase [Anaerolineaceae bacterium]|nr:A/G-specific adenine glycosylase [Anaerolineaceae bacterium]HNS37694.1 A/G-specific adenine glycosylase [Anaerolineaceae bacterium]HNZ13683.1 A/G-specific adenine glycosylase [Anaerolineaceae bacterium]HOD04961.1 A/G-specific adenine glycosylase [Anaerolineaceae bacterium]HOG79601.1 A/G-specific adenine glycosylase [Anaerolineaceae bacterium]
MSAELAEKLLAWYAVNARTLPWRGHPDPYAVWVSEIMLQQTQVDTVSPYFERWMARFPTLEALAAASEQEVLALWEGLGYYSRARNLWRAARQVWEAGGQMPRTAADLALLPGVGRYTAAAIASMAFGQDEAALDGNIRRVLARVFNVTLPARSPEGERQLWALAQQHLPPGRAGDYNQALMDLGSQICTPRAPACLVCPLQALCQAAALGLQAERPVMSARPPVPLWTVTAAVIWRADRVLIARRPSRGLLGGLWEFPGGKLEPGETLPEGLRREIAEELAVEIAVGAELGVYRHAYTHFKVVLHAFACTLVTGEPQPQVASELCWALPAELPDFPMGKIDRQIAHRLLADSQKSA